MVPEILLDINFESLYLHSSATLGQLTLLKGKLVMDISSTPHISNENDLKRIVTPGTISAIISHLRAAADETLELAATLTHAASVADLKATAESLQRDVAELEKIATAWQIRASPVTANQNRARAPTA
jgi:hypothetical protein